MALIVLAISIAILLALITWAKLNPLLALLVTAFCAGVLNGMRADVSWREPARRYAALYARLKA